MRFRRLNILALSLGVASLAAMALAAVTFDPSTGIGFVGKGDVQLAFGWNNHQLQSNAGGVTFSVDSLQGYEAVCTWTTGDGNKGEKVHNVTHKKKTGLSSNIAVAVRSNSQDQVTGFNLEGYSGTVQSNSASMPVVGGPCPGNNGHDGVWTSVTALGEGSGEGLTVNYGNQSVPLAINAN